jgi:hypothetical protein
MKVGKITVEWKQEIKIEYISCEGSLTAYYGDQFETNNDICFNSEKASG